MNKTKADKTAIFETMGIPKALTIMALPSVLSQVIILVYNLADTWFLGRTENTYMIGATSLVLALYLTLVAIANLFGVGGGNLMVRLLGQRKFDEAKKVASYSIALAAIVSVAFSLLCLALMNPILTLLGANENNIDFARHYLIFTVIIGGFPTVMSMALPMLIRNVGYSKEAGIGVAIGGLLNIGLDPLFMFVILPDGYQVLGAGLATMLSNVASMVFFIIVIAKIRHKTVLSFPRRIEKLSKSSLKSFYFVGVPAALLLILFNLLGVVLNRLSVGYGDAALAATGIVLKLEKIPQNIALGVCLGMVPPVAYNYARKDFKRMDGFFNAARIAVLAFGVISALLFYFLAEPLIRVFMNNDEVVMVGAKFLKARSISLPFMVLSFQIINFMQATNRGKWSLLISVINHLVTSIPLMLVLNVTMGIEGLIWSQMIANIANAVISYVIYFLVHKKIVAEKIELKPEMEAGPKAIEEVANDRLAETSSKGENQEENE